MFRATAVRIAALALVFALLLPGAPLAAQEQAPAATAEAIRSSLLQAQFDLSANPSAAQQKLATAQASYEAALAPRMAAASLATAEIDDEFIGANQAINAADGPAFAAARARIWTALLGGGYQMVEQSLSRGDGGEAERWLALREFRQATRFMRPNADATLALGAFEAGTTSAADALVTVRADLLDTYQARLSETLGDLRDPQTQGFPVRRAELAALAGGYFAMLASPYGEQRGAAALEVAWGQLRSLEHAALAGEDMNPALTQVNTALAGFRAAPLSAVDQGRRAGQLMRFLSLVPVEYGRGVRDGRVMIDLEIREATTFHDGAAAAFADLRDSLTVRDPVATEQVAELFVSLERDLAAANGDSAVDPAVVEAQVDELTKLLGALLPAEWQQGNSSADFDVIDSALDQMDQAVAAGRYDLAESARLEAYAILESGPEAKLIVFAPQYKPTLEGLFWYGQDANKGLAFLIEQGAPAKEISASRVALDKELRAAERALVGNNAPAAVATNAAVIVFREGLEAVLILASLMGSLKIGEQRRFRRPLWLGTALAFIASAITWVVAHGALTAMARYGEKLEAVVSLIAIAMLLLITNWFFHDVYWKGWMSNFHQQKRRLLGGSGGHWLGLVVLGFASVYREGFETVIFLQALVLESGPLTVLGGVGVGLAATLLVGMAVFVLQAKLPHKKMLIITGVLICAVLLQMVGNTVHVLQVVGWLPINPIRWLILPHWAGFWFGLYATWEGLALQFVAGVFVVGSYLLAEYMSKRELRIAMRRQAAL